MELVDVLVAYRPAFLKGILVTLQLSLIVWIAGVALGLVLGAAADRYRRLVGAPQFIVAFVLSGIPVIVLLFWAHFPLQALLKKVIDPFVTAAWVLTLVNTFAVAEALKSALRDFPEEYAVAARVCGMGSKAITWKIKFPIVLRRVIPSILTAQVASLQATLFASLISVEEIFRVCQRVNATAYKPVPIYTALALFFLVICMPLNGFAMLLRNKYTRNLSEHS